MTPSLHPLKIFSVREPLREMHIHLSFSAREDQEDGPTRLVDALCGLEVAEMWCGLEFNNLDHTARTYVRNL